MGTCMYMGTCMSVWDVGIVCDYVCMCMCVSVWGDVMYVHICGDMCMCVCMYFVVCICACMYVCVF